jgi:hypothetical protein
MGISATKEDLVIVVGAGASISCGIPSTEDLSELALGTIKSDRVRGLLVEALRGAYGQFNFELLLHALESLELFGSAPANSSLAYRPVISAFADILFRYRELADPAMLGVITRDVISTIHKRVGDLSLTTYTSSEQAEARTDQKRFVSQIADAYRLVVIDLNYDTLWDDVLVDWRDGFVKHSAGNTYATFDAETWMNALRGPEHLLMHLHGSASFSYPMGGMVKRSEFANLSEQLKYDDPMLAQMAFESSFYSGASVNGVSVTAFPIISGLSKTSKLAHNMRPFGHYQMTAANALLRIPRLLLIGYGGHDDYLNALIREHCRMHGDRRRDVVISLLPGAEVNRDTAKSRTLQWLAGQRGWNAIHNQAFAGSDKTLWFGGTLAFVPGGVEAGYRHVHEIVRHLASAGTVGESPVLDAVTARKRAVT